MDSLAEYERIARSLKEDLVARGGAAAELEPQLVLFRGGRYFGSAFVGAPTREQWLGNMEAVTALSCADAVVHVTEAFVARVDPAGRSDAEMEAAMAAGEVGGYAHGDLATRHAAGDPDVTEALTVAVYRRGHAAHVISTDFTCEGRTVRWGTPMLPDSNLGTLPELFAHAMEMSAKTTAETGSGPLPWEMFAATMGALGIPVVVAPPRSVPRNSPCPCGSGVKFKLCCGSVS